jgi:thioredoxin 1
MSALTITKDNFEKEVLQSQTPVLLDFWSPRCGPCQMVLPLIDELAGEIKGARIGKVNVDEQPELARTFQVMSIPMLIVVKGGKIVKSAVGARPKAAIQEMISEFIA